MNTDEFNPQRSLAYFVATETAMCAQAMMRFITADKWHDAFFYANRICGLFNGLHGDLALQGNQSSIQYTQEMLDFAIANGDTLPRCRIYNALKVAHEYCDRYFHGLKTQLFAETDSGTCYFTFKPSTTEVVL